MREGRGDEGHYDAKIARGNHPATILFPGAYQVNDKRRNVIVASAYLPYDSLCPPPTQKLRDLVAYAESSGLELLISCEANAQHIFWGSSKCNPIGEKLFDFITSAGLMTANVGCALTFVRPRRSKVIDLTIYNSKLLELIRDSEC